ncbi:helix-turn-helix domain-containing protein [Rhizobium sp. AG855]|uniref:GlxA family transcriptional regulator n=1 Tax=Rhizobium sp. AG855 TaxID=2183898 RepID=UPI000FF5D82E|nr:helix-turn-helix domain-containing protein [Rhizobium sp. AG855]RKE86346.1 AraC family transcriptional regulator with amidase-like domain [Rhizobium sp. AG855]
MSNISQFEPMMMGVSSHRKIAFIGYDGVQALDVVGPMEAFAIANQHLTDAGQSYEIILASPLGGPVSCSGLTGLSLGGAIALRDLPSDLDTIIVPGGSEDALRDLIFNSDLLPWLSTRISATRRLASVCTGAFVLAAGGYLNGKRATTHWASVALLEKLCPQAVVEPDAIFVADPPVFTSAGITAGIDLSLSMIEADFGHKVALAVARQMVLFMRRPGGQSQFSSSLAIQSDVAPRLRSLLHDIIGNPVGDFSGPALAARCGMSERSFSRAFRKQTGTTPAQFVETIRIDRAKLLLESSDWPLARIAERSGFGSLDTLHRVFQKRLSITPSFYRERFATR